MSSVNFHVVNHVLPCQHIRHYRHATASGDDEQPQIAIKQYIPRENTVPRHGDVTIIAAHANGVGKELYEPLWDDLHQLANSSSGFRIRSIWMADVAHQGASGVLNEAQLGNDPSWYDHPRDLLHMVNHFRTLMPRPLVGFGHSMGGNNIVNLALMHPRLFQGVVMVDPVISRHLALFGNYEVAYLSTFRRDVWPSRAAAEALMRNNKFYQGWDSRVLQLYIEYGLRELPAATISSQRAPPTEQLRLQLQTPVKNRSIASEAPRDKPVTLTTTKHQEVFSFLRPNLPTAAQRPSDTALPASHADLNLLPPPRMPFYAPAPVLTFHQLQHLQPQCIYIFGGDSILSTPELRADKMAQTGVGLCGSGGIARGTVTEHVIEGAGHFVPFEQPGEVARWAVPWMEAQITRWLMEEEEQSKAWASVLPQYKGRISESWEQLMRSDVKKMLDERRATKL